MANATSRADTRRPTRTGTTRPSTDRRRGSVTSTRAAAFTVPTLTPKDGEAVATALQQQLVGLIDLALTLKHVHWNVVGPSFQGVHRMLDPQYAGVQTMIDDVAERVATLGSVPNGLPGHIVEQRSWDDYDLGRADAIAHLGALDLVYEGVISSHREAIDKIGDTDPVSEDLLIGQTAELERYQWFVRSHLADWAGGMANAGAESELAAARAVRDKQPTPAKSATRGR